MIMKILICCLGNSDRSPFLAAFLAKILKDAGHTDVSVESAGIIPICKSGRGASAQGIVCAKRIGLDLTDHKSRLADDLTLADYDLIVGVSEEVVTHLFKAGAAKGKLFNANIPNPWPSEVQSDHDEVAALMTAAAYRVMTRYFPTAN